MNPLWDYFWPVFVAGLVIGAVGGTIAFRMKRRLAIGIAAACAASIAAAAIWHGPLGAAGRFEAAVQRGIGQTLQYYEMTQVRAGLHHGPLSRRVMLSGPADDFQRSELARLMDDVPGVGGATWSTESGGLPLIAESGILAVVGFLFGLLLAYLVELRRRHNAQWKW